MPTFKRVGGISSKSDQVLRLSEQKKNCCPPQVSGCVTIAVNVPTTARKTLIQLLSSWPVGGTRIEKYSWGKVASVFYNSSASMSIGLIAVTLFAVFGMLLVKGSPTFSPPNLQTFVSFQVIHDVGMALGLIVGLSVVANLAIMARYMHMPTGEKFGLSTRLRTWLSSLIASVTKQSMAQTDFLKCTNRNRYFAHMALFWGFVGLSIATAVDFVLGLGKTPLYPFPLQRVLGILAGVAFTVAGGYYFLKRLRKDERHARSSHLSDWVFVTLILLRASLASC